MSELRWNTVSLVSVFYYTLPGNSHYSHAAEHFAFCKIWSRLAFFYFVKRLQVCGSDYILSCLDLSPIGVFARAV